MSSPYWVAQTIPTTPYHSYSPFPPVAVPGSPFNYSSYALPTPHGSPKDDYRVRAAKKEKEQKAADAKRAETKLKREELAAYERHMRTSATPTCYPTTLPYAIPATPYPSSPYMSMPMYSSPLPFISTSPQGVDIHIGNSPYATPTYHTLSPAPPLYDFDDYTDRPDDIETDKWEEAKNGYCYDNRSDPVALNSVHSVLEVNPVIANGSIPLIMDLCRRKGDVCTMEQVCSSWWADNKKIRAQPATLPRVQKLRLVSSRFRDVITVMNAGGVTVGDVIAKLFNHFEALLSHSEYESVSEEQRTALAHSMWANHSHMRAMGDPMPHAQPYLRIVDKLLGESVFDGLEPNPDFVTRRLGERDCSVLQLHFKSRSREW